MACDILHLSIRLGSSWHFSQLLASKRDSESTAHSLGVPIQQVGKPVLSVVCHLVKVETLG